MSAGAVRSGEANGLLPCPFCGRQAAKIIYELDEDWSPDADFDSCAFVCDASAGGGQDGCGAHSGYRSTLNDAEKAWNQRAPRPRVIRFKLTEKRRFYLALAIGVIAFIGLGFLTDALFDSLFLRFTSIQDGVVACSGAAVNRECWTEDSTRAYDSRLWAVTGNLVAVFFTGARAFVGYRVYKLINK